MRRRKRVEEMKAMRLKGRNPLLCRDEKSSLRARREMERRSKRKGIPFPQGNRRAKRKIAVPQRAVITLCLSNFFAPLTFF
jgi:hypothetical protein